MAKEIKEPIFVVDTETTGLNGHPSDLIVEIGIYRINEDLSVDHVHDTLISYPETKKDQINNCYWSEKLSKVKFKDLHEYPDLKTVWADIKNILDGKKVISWNMDFDFGKFFDRMNSDFPKITYSKLSCPMIVSTDIVKTFWNDFRQSWKWPKLNEASKFYNIFLDSEGYGFHRADYDTHVAALVVVEMIRKDDYQV